MPDDDMLKPMLRQSERQLGAFMFLHALEFGSTYEQPKAKITKEYNFIEFRNAVIHRGLIPTVEEAHKFGAEVYQEIYSLFGKIRGNHADSINSVIMNELGRRRAKLPDDMRVSTSAGGNLFSIANQENPSSSHDAISSFGRRIERLKAAPLEMMNFAKNRAFRSPRGTETADFP